MPSADKAFMLAGTVSYLACVALLAVRSLRERRFIFGGMLLPLLAGIVLQGYGLHLRGLAVGGCPVGNPFETLQFISWILAGLTLLLGAGFRHSLPGAAAATVSAVLSTVALAVPEWDAHRVPHVLGNDPWLETHAALAVTSYGVFAALAVSCSLHLFQYRSLKSRRPRNPAGMLPSLQELDRLNLRLLLIGTTLLSVAIAIGVVFWLRHPSNVGAAKLTAAFALWTAAATVISLRAAHVAVGKRLSWFGIVLFLSALASLWPVNRSGSTPPPAPPHHG